MAIRRQVPLNRDFFVKLAESIRQTWCTPPGDEHAELDRSLREYDSGLKLLWSGDTRTFWVCSELHQAPGLYFPFWNVGANPDHADVLAGVKEKRIEGRADEATKALLDETKQIERRKLKDDAARFMPGLEEYAPRLRKQDDDALRAALARDMGREVRRNVA